MRQASRDEIAGAFWVVPPFPLAPTEPKRSAMSQTSIESKSVRWSSITVYEFPVSIGGSAVPRRGGPAVGLARTAQSVWSTSVDAAQQQLETTHAKYKRTSATTAARQRQRRRVRWLKPLERVTMLEKAGYSEERIYRMLMESSRIAQSRRLCLRVASLECAA